MQQMCHDHLSWDVEMGALPLSHLELPTLGQELFCAQT